MKFYHVLFLGVAAGAGYLYYNRFQAVSNIIAGTEASSHSQLNSQGYSDPGMGGVGGLGGVGANDNGGGLGGGNSFSSTANSATFNLNAMESLHLMQAAAKGNREGVEKLLANHIAVDGRDDNRRTALMYASWIGRNDICALLIAAGAKARFQDRNGNNAYDYAASRGLTDTVRFLLGRSTATDDNNYIEYSSIMQATLSSDKSLLPPGNGALASVNRLTPESQTPLHIAASNGATDLMGELIKRGADVNKDNDVRQSPLMWAAWNNQIEAATLLADKGADMNARDLGGNTALILAVQHHNTEMVKRLLEKGADKTIANKEEKTPLMIADLTGLTDIAALLQ